MGQVFQKSCYKYIQELKVKDEQLIEKIRTMIREMQILKKGGEGTLKLKSTISEMK